MDTIGLGLWTECIVWRGPRGGGIQRGGRLKGHRWGWAERCHLSPVVYVVPRRLHRPPWLSRKCQQLLFLSTSLVFLPAYPFHVHNHQEIIFQLSVMLHFDVQQILLWLYFVSTRFRWLCCELWGSVNVQERKWIEGLTIYMEFLWAIIKTGDLRLFDRSN